MRNRLQGKSFLYGIISCVLALIWVALILWGIDYNKEQSSNRIINKQEVVLTIPENKIKDEKAINSQDEHEQAQNIPATLNEDKNTSYISVLISDIDTNIKLAEIFARLPKSASIGISPYNPFANEVAHIAKTNGNDIFIELPFISEKNSDQAREYDLVSSLDSEEIRYRLENILRKIEKPDGVYSLGHEEFLNSASGVATIIGHLHKSNLFFLYGINGKTPVLESDNESVFTVEACDNFINKDQDKQRIEKELHFSAEIAKNKGKSIIVMQYDENNIMALENWIKSLDKEKFKLVSIKGLPKTVKVTE